MSDASVGSLLSVASLASVESDASEGSALLTLPDGSEASDASLGSVDSVGTDGSVVSPLSAEHPPSEEQIKMNKMVLKNPIPRAAVSHAATPVPSAPPMTMIVPRPASSKPVTPTEIVSPTLATSAWKNTTLAKVNRVERPVQSVSRVTWIASRPVKLRPVRLMAAVSRIRVISAPRPRSVDASMRATM